MSGGVEEPEVDPPVLRFSRVALDVAFPGVRGDVLIQTWSDGSITCALRPATGAVRTWGRSFDTEAPR